MIICMQCYRNSLNFKIGKIVAPDGSSTLGVVEITCRNFGTGKLSSRCVYTPGDQLFIDMAELYVLQVEFERESTEGREKYDMESQIIMGRASVRIAAMREDNLIRAQAGDTEKMEYRPIGNKWPLGTQTDENKK